MRMLAQCARAQQQQQTVSGCQLLKLAVTASGAFTVGQGGDAARTACTTCFCCRAQLRLCMSSATQPEQKHTVQLYQGWPPARRAQAHAHTAVLYVLL